MKFSLLRPFVRLSKSKSPWFFLGCVGLSIFVCEVLIMFLFMVIPKLPNEIEAFLDATLLSILVAPVLYYSLYQPLKRENRERQLVEQELRQSAAQLQLKTEKLTQTLQELQASQLKLIQSEKMSSLGQLVAGVAHEINNPVNFIHGNLSPVQEYTQELLTLVQLYQQHYPHPVPQIQAAAAEIDLDFLQTDLPKLVSSMSMGTDRIRQIVLSLRNFSRTDEADFKAVDLHEGIDSTLMILQHRLKARPERPEIEVIKDYGDLPLVECYAGQLNQVFMNILANAIDALDELSAERTVAERQASPNQITIRTAVVDRSWVEIAIADTGKGISEAIQRRIFEPFFTTKPIGKGTGMGLSLSYQIVTERHGGKLRCCSTPDAGSAFVIQLPIRQQVANPIA